MKKEKSDLLRKSMSFANFFLLFLFQCIIFSASIIFGTREKINPYVACAIAFLSLLSIVILALESKRNDDESITIK